MFMHLKVNQGIEERDGVRERERESLVNGDGSSGRERGKGEEDGE